MTMIGLLSLPDELIELVGSRSLAASTMDLGHGAG